MLELRGLAPGVRTRDVESWLETVDAVSPAETRPLVRWVDDASALAVFVDPAAARAALARAGREASIGSAYAWPEASAAARQLPVSQLQPPRPRPQGTAVVARRLIGAALAVDLRDRKSEAELRDARRAKLEALEKEKARQAARQVALDEAWE